MSLRLSLLIAIISSASISIKGFGLEESETLIVALGDSLTEGYGVSQSSAYPALLEKKLKADHFSVKIQNSGISGSTSASGPSRMKWLLKSKPKIIILALGANDGLRGLSTDEMEKNLAETIRLAESEKVKVILCGMQMPTNYGADYRTRFEKVFSKLAKTYPVTFVPFLLEGVAMKKDLNQSDSIHPNEKGHIVIADLLYPVVKKLLERRHGSHEPVASLSSCQHDGLLSCAQDRMVARNGLRTQESP